MDTAFYSSDKNFIICNKCYVDPCNCKVKIARGRPVKNIDLKNIDLKNKLNNYKKYLI